jgi:hypothetical protein
VFFVALVPQFARDRRRHRHSAGLALESRRTACGYPAGWAAGAAEQVAAVLALVAGQDVEPAEGSDGTDGR